MSSQRRKDSSRANGAKSHGPITPEGKKRSSQNALRHGLFAEFLLLDGEDAEDLDHLRQEHIDRFQPADAVEIGIIDQICAAQWRLYRVLAMETQAFNQQIGIVLPVGGENQFGHAVAFEAVAALPFTALLQRYETRLQLLHQRALRSLKLLRSIGPPSLDKGPKEDAKNEPSPIPKPPERAPAEPQPAESETLGTACVSSPKPLPGAPAITQSPVNPSSPPSTPGTLHRDGPKVPGGNLPAA